MPRVLLDDLGVGVVLAALHAVLGPPGGVVERPLVQPHAALAERVLQALVGPGEVAVERYRELAGEQRHGSASLTHWCPNDDSHRLSHPG